MPVELTGTHGRNHEHNQSGRGVMMAERTTMDDIAHQLTRIADAMQEPAGMQVSEQDALTAWGLRVYEEDFLNALERLGVEIV